MRGFSLIEIGVVLGILAILGIIALPVSHFFEEDTALNSAAQEIGAVLKLAQSKTLSSEGGHSYGVFFDVANGTYTLFQGPSFAQRNITYDQTHTLLGSVAIDSVTFSSGEVVFAKITGFPGAAGNVRVGLRARPEKSQTVFVDHGGRVNMLLAAVASDAARVNDSRHVHVFYEGRGIDTQNESLKLTFPNSGNPVIEIVPLAPYLVGGQFLWKGNVAVGGQMQTLLIQTHALNEANIKSTFSIHRDRALNTKGVYLELTGDSSGFLLEYSDTSIPSQGTSIYVSAPELQ